MHDTQWRAGVGDQCLNIPPVQFSQKNILTIDGDNQNISNTIRITDGKCAGSFFARTIGSRTDDRQTGLVNLIRARGHPQRDRRTTIARIQGNHSA